MATMKDVAKHARLSVSCVSKYLNHPDSVLPQTKQKIDEAIAALDYKPSFIAQSLRTKRSRIIVVIMESVINPFFAALFEAIRCDCEQNGYFVMLHTLSDRSYSRSDFSYADGIILCFPDKTAHVGNILKAAGHTPAVLIHGCPAEPCVPSVLVDIGKGCAEAVSYLLSLGCRSFITVGGDPDSDMSRVKRNAICQTLSGQKGTTVQNIPTTQSHSGGMQAIGQIEHQLPGIDAILCESDAIAAGVLSALHRKGFRVPEDIRVVGYDDILLASMFNPPISTVAIPIRQLGSAAVSMVCRIINGEQVEDQYFDPSMKIRSTT